MYLLISFSSSFAKKERKKSNKLEGATYKGIKKSVNLVCVCMYVVKRIFPPKYWEESYNDVTIYLI